MGGKGGWRRRRIGPEGVGDESFKELEKMRERRDVVG